MQICTLASGSRGNCSLVSVLGHNYLIDAGISMKRIRDSLALCSLNPGNIDAIFVTHQHSDHISGLKMLSKYYSIPVFAPPTVASYLRCALGLSPEVVKILPVNGCYQPVSGLTVRSFPTSHDTEESVGYRFEADCVFAFATDTGCVDDELFGGLQGADAVVIESNHDVEMLRYGNYPYELKRRILSKNGHLSNDDCACLAERLAGCGTRYFILAHLSRENNTPARAFAAVSSALEGTGARLFVAPESERLSLEIGGGAG